jgi:hypothetical protein
MKIFRPANLSFLVTKSIRNNKRHARARRWRGGHLFILLLMRERKNKEQTQRAFGFMKFKMMLFLLYLDSTHGLIMAGTGEAGEACEKGKEVKQITRQKHIIIVSIRVHL